MFKKSFLVGPLLAFLALSNASAALAAEPLSLLPNDTFYNHQWGMDYVRAPEAWATMYGLGSKQPTSTREVVVAQIDGGIDFSHPDLKDALWTNPDEILNGKDDDENGYVDDLHGWNFVNSTSDPKPVKSILYMNGSFEHGTSVATMIVGRGNDNIGVAGMAWKAKIMPLVILGATGSGETSDLVQAIRYAIANRADIISMSLEGSAQDPEVKTAIQDATARGILVVMAAGNESANLDNEPAYPSCYPGAAGQSVLVVSAIESNGSKHDSTNFGDQCVNIAAPGADITSGRPTFDEQGGRENVSGYGTWSGTSLAVPFVSGVAALLKAEHPDWTGEQLASRILATVQPFKKGVASTGMGKGVLDAGAALAPVDASKYGPWQLLAANPGQPPVIKIEDEAGKLIYSFPAGNPGDKRGLRAAFIRWDADRKPDVLVTAQGDEKGEWRVYRWDGVLLAAGQASQNADDKIKGGLLLATQDLRAANLDQGLLTEADGDRAWRMDPTDGLGKPFYATSDLKPMGTLAVGIQRPEQAMFMLTRSSPNSELVVLRDTGVGEASAVTTTKPYNLKMARGRTPDGREAVSLIQSGKPTYLVERNGFMDVTHEDVKVSRWLQAPLGLDDVKNPGFKFYDFWPR
ncbi:MAG: S8 family peptidase [Patescibacteria group bacterium]|nr:S8 family peptidase [Patescibacteria group bacterium]